MKILHTADWHLGKRLGNFSRLPEQIAVLEEIEKIAQEQQVDMVLIAGDIFDNFNPSTEAVELFYRSAARLARLGSCPVIAIAGNHDSPDRIEAPNPLAQEAGIIFLGYPETEIAPFSLPSGLEVSRTEPGFLELKIPHHPPVRILTTPYANESRLKQFLGIEMEQYSLSNFLGEKWNYLAEKYCDQAGINLLLTHLFVLPKGHEKDELYQESDDEKPILHVGGAQAVFASDIPEQIQYTALGHLHRFIEVRAEPKPIVYSSSPLAYSFAEANQEKFLVLIDVEPDKYATYSKIPLKSGRPVLRKKFTAVADALKWLNENQNCLVELTIATDEFLSAADKSALTKAHDGLIAIIPEIKNTNSPSQLPQIDLSKNIDELFQEFFIAKTGQSANPELMSIFHEVMAFDKSNSETNHSK